MDGGQIESTRSAIYENACAYNGFVPFTEHKRPFKQIADLDLGSMELIETYLGKPEDLIETVRQATTMAFDADQQIAILLGQRLLGAKTW